MNPAAHHFYSRPKILSQVVPRMHGTSHPTTFGRVEVVGNPLGVPGGGARSHAGKTLSPGPKTSEAILIFFRSELVKNAYSKGLGAVVKVCKQIWRHSIRVAGDLLSWRGVRSHFGNQRPSLCVSDPYILPWLHFLGG